MNELKVANDDLIQKVIGLAIEVHKHFGPGLLESVYEAALVHELANQGIVFERQKEMKVSYKEKALGLGFRADIIVDHSLLLELKCVEGIKEIHIAQVITYLKLLNFKTALILNFNVQLLKKGIKKISI